MVTQWMHIKITLNNFTLQPLYDEVLNLLTSFSYKYLSHIYSVEILVCLFNHRQCHIIVTQP